MGCGKSTAVKYFAQLGIPVLDADKIARSLLEPNQPTLQAIIDAFGKSFLQRDGRLNRAALKAEVFNDPKALQKLESITHPRVREVIVQQLEHLNQHSHAAYALVDIPLLVEKGYCCLFDHIVVVDCVPQQQLERVSSRDNMDQTIIQSIMQAQASRSERLKKATHVLDNTGEVEQLYSQVLALHDAWLVAAG